MLLGALKDGQEIGAYLPIRRKRMLHEFAAVFFVDQPRLIQTTRVFADRFFVGAKCFHDFFKRHALVPLKQQQDLDAVMIGYPLQVPLYLPCRFYLPHTRIISDSRSLQYPYILKYIGVL